MLFKRAMLAMLLLVIPVLIWISISRLNGDVRYFAIGALLYWICPVVLLGTGAVFYRARKVVSPRLPPGIYAIGCAYALLLVFLATKAFHPAARVQWDETELLGTSYAMAFRHSATAPLMAVPGPAGPEPVAFGLGHRPMLFSFLVSVMHSVAGPSERNPIRLNLFLLGVWLFFLFLRGYRAGGFVRAFAAPLLAASVPLLFWVGTSGGMDLLSFVLLAVLACSVFDFARAPRAEMFPPLVILAVLASYTRYESVAVAMILLLTSVLYGRRGGIAASKLAGPLLGLPLLLLPLLLQLAGPAFSFHVPGAAPAFSLKNLPGNAAALLHALLTWRIGLYDGPLSVLGVTALALAAFRGSRKSWPAIVGPAMGCWLVILFCFFDANPFLAQSARLYLPVAVAVALGVLSLPDSLPGRCPRYAPLVLAALSFGGMWIADAGTKLLPDSLESLAIEKIAEFTRQDSPGTLYVFDPPNYLVSQGKSAVSSEVFWQGRERWRELRARGLLTRIAWIRLGTEFPDAGSEAARKGLEKIAGAQLAVFPLRPYPTVIRELPF